jgi:hypothetical protein
LPARKRLLPPFQNINIVCFGKLAKLAFQNILYFGTEVIINGSMMY